MLKKHFDILGTALAIFLGHGHAFMFVLIPFLGLLSQYPALNLFAAMNAHHVMAALALLGLVLGIAAVLGPKRRLAAGAWLGGMAAYGWLSASVILRPAPVVIWSRGRDLLEYSIVAPIALWLASAGAVVVCFLGWCLLLIAGNIRSRLAAQQATR